MRSRCGVLAFVGAFVRSDALENAENPIRKVVTLLQDMQKKVIAEGDKEKELYEKFDCFCKGNDGQLSAAITAGETATPTLQADITSSEEKLSQTKSDLKDAQTDRADAKNTVAEAKALREKEAAAFAAQNADYMANIAAMVKAIAALEKGVAGGFLQTQSAQVLREWIQRKQDVLDADRQAIVAFLSGTQGYSPQSGEIIGILKEMLDTMRKNSGDVNATEAGAIQTFNALTAAKAKEIEALTASIEAKTREIGELGVKIVELKDDAADTAKQLEQDKAFLANLKENCAKKAAEWDERQKTRAEELTALADTIKVLNDDDALELFKKTLPSPAPKSFIQMASKSAQQRALEEIRKAQAKASGKDKESLALLAMALSGKGSSKGGFDKVIGMIDEMVQILKKEQQDDEDKKEYCNMQLDLAEDKQKELTRNLENTNQELSNSADEIARLQEELKALQKSIAELDKSVTDATAQRQNENSEYKALMASNTAAKELLNFAKNRLNKFYNPKLYKAPPKKELDAQTRVAVNMGAIAAPTDAPSGIAGTGIAEKLSFIQVTALRQPVAPETWNAYQAKSSETNGVIGMMDLLIKDLDKEMTEAETDEKNGQADYETFISEAKAKRMTDTAAVATKQTALADAESRTQTMQGQKSDIESELQATGKYMASVHAECDWLLQYFDVRKEARAGEVDSLVKAKSVLSGADFSLAQTRSRGFLRRA